MVTMQAVIEVPAFDAGSTQPWPVASVTAGSWLTLNAGSTDEEVGLFVATLADRLDVEFPGCVARMNVAQSARHRQNIDGRW